MRRVALAMLALVLVGAPADAQHWITRDRCTVSDIAIDPAVLPDHDLAALRAATADVPNGVGTYWRVTSPQGAVSHMWGTWHSNDPVMLDIPTAVLDDLGGARVALFEFDPVFASRRAVENAAAPRDFWRSRPGGLAALNLPDDMASWINARLIGFGWGDGAADHMTPGALAETLLSDPCNDFAVGTYPIQDSYLQTLAAISGADIRGLEPSNTFRARLNRQSNLALARDMIQLYALSLSPDGTAAERATAYALYMRGEHGVARAWERTVLAERFGAARATEMQDRVDAYLLDERNGTFVTAAAPHLDAGGAFIAVGAWHLQGRLGMVERLRAAGFQVARVPLDREKAAP